ncbi:hypothetical protein PV327_003900 [Microctonus hyperodae]|uniref:Uncharacterized protein n=1 Tax=Microctonus hyperodae TaxID=165561 RepID=A0AA39L1J1_MICHY|nr:hypothetical protein PV327_003900 [Microctonus hyperodae]
MEWDRTWVAGLAKWESGVGVVYGRNALDGKGNCGTLKEDEVDEKEENRDYEQEMEVSLQSLRRKTLQAPTTRRRRVPAPKGCDRNGMVVVGGEGAACATRLEALVVRVNATRMGDVDFDVAVTIVWYSDDADAVNAGLMRRKLPSGGWCYGSGSELTRIGVAGLLFPSTSTPPDDPRLALGW